MAARDEPAEARRARGGVLRRAALVLLSLSLAACATIIGVSNDVIEVGADASSDADDEGEAAPPDAADAAAADEPDV